MKRILEAGWKVIALGCAATLLFFLIPLINFQLSKTFIFSEYIHLDVDRLTADLRRYMTLPLSEYLPYQYLKWAVLIWFLFLARIAAYIFRKTRNWHRRIYGAISTALLVLFIFPDILLFGEKPVSSINQGHISKGSLSSGKRVNYRGDNFSTYSFSLYLLGRTFAHDKVRSTILDAYEICETTSPNTNYVLGEIGWKNGGQFLPHRTHQIGTSVDFMTPYLKYEKSFSRNNIFNYWGYKLEFDEAGESDKYQIDFEATAQHLLALKKAAVKNDLIIQKVIFDPVLQRHLRKTSVWRKIKNLPFSKKRVAWRHDDHYHVDFAVKG